jgi:hypothetical protein
MDDDRIERLLSGYRLPEVPRELDRRVLSEGAAIMMERARTGVTLEDVGWFVLYRLGFGYICWLFDFVTATDAEYHVEFI